MHTATTILLLLGAGYNLGRQLVPSLIRGAKSLGDKWVLIPIILLMGVFTVALGLCLYFNNHDVQQQDQVQYQRLYQQLEGTK